MDGQKRTGITRQFAKEYNSWKAMKRRCYDPQDASYKYLGGRGIEVCLRWRNSFAAFLEDMGIAPSPVHTVCREDKAKDYDPENCSWATAKEQQLKTCKPRWFTYRGLTLCAADWSIKTGVPTATIMSRLRFGWTFGQAIEREPRKKKSYKSTKHVAAAPA